MVLVCLFLSLCLDNGLISHDGLLTSSVLTRYFFQFCIADSEISTGSFLPVTLEQLARERGVLLSDKTTPCIQPLSDVSSNAIRSLVDLFSRVPKEDKGQCIVSVFGSEVNTASFAMYTFSLAVFTQALVLVSFSAVADHGSFTPFS